MPESIDIEQVCKGYCCPKPVSWGRIYRELKRCWKQDARCLSKPPKPQFYAAWMFVSLSEERSHKVWRETVQWARDYGLPASSVHLEEEEKCLRRVDGNDY
jgi:hypothetical protein